MADTVQRNRSLLRARDAMDRRYAQPLDIPELASVAGLSPAHFSREFKEVFGETPNRYLQRRRVERAMYLLRTSTTSITDICFDVGFGSLGTFSRMFKEVTGMPPKQYRQQHSGPITAPNCFVMAWMRPSSFGEAIGTAAALNSGGTTKEVE